MTGWKVIYLLRSFWVFQASKDRKTDQQAANFLKQFSAKKHPTFKTWISFTFFSEYWLREVLQNCGELICNFASCHWHFIFSKVASCKDEGDGKYSWSDKTSDNIQIYWSSSVIHSILTFLVGVSTIRVFEANYAWVWIPADLT